MVHGLRAYGLCRSQSLLRAISRCLSRMLEGTVRRASNPSPMNIDYGTLVGRLPLLGGCVIHLESQR